MPSHRRPLVNDLFLRRGRWIERGRSDEVLASEGFVLANQLELGDRVPAVLNGRRRELTIVGVALSPEFIYNIRPGEMVPDDRRFGTLWMDEQALAAAFDMEGGFNDLVLKVAPGASIDEVIARVDRILEPYGGLGAIPRALQLSHWTVQNELAQLQTFGFMLPMVFMIVAAFILNVALTRALALQRPQIAALKALGYDNRAIGWHYMKWALAIGLAGVVIGGVLGAMMGTLVIGLYNTFFRFPVLLFSVPPSVVGGATVMTLVAAVAGAFTAVRRAVRVPPAEAMRPEVPTRYRRSLFETPFVSRHLGTAGRMVLRNVMRHPLRAAASVFGVSFAVAILMIGFVFNDAVDHLIVTQFWEAERQDVTVNFIEPRDESVRYALARLPGVVAVEPQRTVAARVRSGYRDRYLSITGVSTNPRFKRIVDRDGREIRMPPSGVVLSLMLANVLGVVPGDEIALEVLEGQRPARRVQVTGLVDDIMGLSAYMDMTALHQMMREGEVANSALMLIDPAQEVAARLGAQDDAGGGGGRLQARGASELPRHHGRQHERVDLHQSHLRGHHRLRRRVQRRARVPVGTQPRAGQPACPRLHPRRDFAHPDGRARPAHARRPPGWRPLRLLSVCGDRRHDRQRGLPVSAVRLATRGGAVVPGHHRRDRLLGTGGQAKARSAGPGCSPEDPRIARVYAIPETQAPDCRRRHCPGHRRHGDVA